MDMTPIRAFDLPDTSPAVLDALPVEVLHNLVNEAESHARQASTMLGILHGVLARRYAAGINDTGTHHRREGDYRVTITVPKNVSWDQAALGRAIETIKGWGEDPAEYVETKLTVSETRYKAWPKTIRDLFEPARTVRQGKPKIEIALAAENQEAA